MSKPPLPPRPGFDSGAEGAPSRTGLIRALGVVALAALVAVGGVWVGFVASPLQRLSNTDLKRTGIPDSYLVLNKTDPTRGLLVNRRDATVRRSQKGLPGATLRVERFAFPGSTPDHWLLRSKKEGVILLVPLESVQDPLFPFLYGFVRDEEPDLELPRAGWTQLFVNRVYAGLYLRCELPRDPRRKDGRVGDRRMLLEVSGTRVWGVDTYFDPNARLLADRIAEGEFPELGDAPPILDWLATRAPGAAFVMDGAPPYALTPYPAPVSLLGWVAAVHGEAPPTTRDERGAGWVRRLRSRNRSFVPEFQGSKAMRDAFDLYARDFRVARQTHRVLVAGNLEPGPPVFPAERLAALDLVSEPLP